MIKISILYPSSAGSRFDVDYYLEKHMPTSVRLLGASPGFKGVSVERGMDMPGKQARYAVMCHFLFDTVEDFLAAFMPHAEELRSDMPNYTDVDPFIQVSELVFVR